MLEQGILWVLTVTLLLSGLYIHELGHWALLKRHGIETREFGVGFGPVLLKFGRFRTRLLLIGAYVTPDVSTFDSLAPSKKLQIILAGPAASFLYAIALFFAGMLSGDPRTVVVLHGLAGINFAIGIVNLFPIPPLDGWKALEAFLQLRDRSMTPVATRIANGLGHGVLWGLGTWFLVTFLGYLA